jgi:cell division protein FtsW
VSSVGAASPRPRVLRLVRPDERPSTRARTDLRTRRTLALLLGSTAFLVGSGLVMVLSASSVTAFAEYGDSFLFVQRQAAYAVVGVLALLLTSRMR